MVRKGLGLVLAVASVLALGTVGCEGDDSSSAEAATATAEADAGATVSTDDDGGDAGASVTAEAHVQATAGHCISLAAVVKDLPACDPTKGRARGAAFAAQLPLLGASSLDDTGMVTSAVGKTLSETSAGVAGLISTGAIDVSASSSANGAEATSSVASANLSVVAAALGLGVSAVKATADSACGVASGSSSIAGLTLNGKAVAVTGAPNQVVTVPGGLVKLVLNEQVAAGPAGITVNAIHLSALSSTVLGLDVIIGSATAQAPSLCGCTGDGGLLDLDASVVDDILCGLDLPCPADMVCLPK